MIGALSSGLISSRQTGMSASLMEMLTGLRIDLQERHRRVPRPSRDLGSARAIGDLKQQAGHQVAPEQAQEFFGHRIGIAKQKPGCAGVCHDRSQCVTRGLAGNRIQRLRDLWRMYGFGRNTATTTGYVYAPFSRS